MTTITRSELLALARVSNIDLTPEELESMPARLAEVLQYAAMVKELADTPVQDHDKNSNVLRPDTPIAFDPKPILAQAPEREADYFVVPLILDGSSDTKTGTAR